MIATSRGSVAITSSGDGKWIAVRRGGVISVLAGAGGPVCAQLELPTAAVDLAWLGTPAMLGVIVGLATPPMMALYTAELAPIAQLELVAGSGLVTSTGQRAVLGRDGKTLTVVRATPKSLVGTVIDPGAPIDLAVGLDREQLLVASARKLEVWDTAAARPALRLNLQLPPTPRVVGYAHGHLWAFQPGGEDVYLYRLSDGRPFQHHAYAPILAVISHPASPVVVVVTPRGLLRLHCTAHTLVLVDSPWVPAHEPGSLALLAIGEDITLLGLVPGDADGDPTPWRIPLFTAPLGATVPGSPPTVAEPIAEHAAEGIPDSQRRLMAMVERTRGSAPSMPAAVAIGPSGAAGAAAEPESQDGHVSPLPSSPSPLSPPPPPSPPPAAAPSVSSSRPAAAALLADWRAPLVALGIALVRSLEPPEIPTDLVGQLGLLAERWRLSPVACRALTALYALHLVGEPRVAIARLANALGEWPDALGTGELAQRMVVRERDGKVYLRAAMTAFLDGRLPTAARFIGDGAPAMRPGLYRLPRGTASEVELATELASRMGRIALPIGKLSRAFLEARLHSAAAVLLSAPAELTTPIAHDAVVLILHGDVVPPWLARVGPPIAA